ncbi:glycosyl transferase family 2 [bacterium]|nr:glycosyl transferase family 2 [bacterium]|tara:strand:- start:5768 stop:6520 length:753 start_codon:yes stop_codon:yes gene_type:complete
MTEKEVELDIIMPVYNEGENILDALEGLRHGVKTSFRVFVCYDFDEDNTLKALEKADCDFDIVLVKNRSTGPHEAVMTGFERSSAGAVITYPADEAYNAEIIDRMYAKFKEGNDVVVASRLTKGGEMSGGPRFKSFLVRSGSFFLHHFAALPATDATYGWRMFSRRIINTVEIESTAGFTYAIELLVKCHRLKWNIDEVPARWLMREKGESRFNLRKWFPLYAKWFFYALATTYLRRGPDTVKLKPGAKI